MFGQTVTARDRDTARLLLTDMRRTGRTKLQPGYVRKIHPTLMPIVDGIRANTKGLSAGFIVEMIADPSACPTCVCGKEIITRFCANTPALCNRDFDCPRMKKVVREQRRRSSESKYGVSHPMMLAEVRAVQQRTMVEKHGVAFAMKRQSSREKRTRTNLRRFGVAHPMQLRFFQDKVSITNLRKYGVERVVQDPATFLRIMDSGFRHKRVRLGEREVDVQGFEDVALRYLEWRGVSPNRMTVFAEGTVPSFWYLLGGKRRRYFPDIMIDRDKIVEVKSTWTLYGTDTRLAIVQEKARAVMREGYHFELVLVYKLANRNRALVLPRGWENASRRELVSTLLEHASQR